MRQWGCSSPCTDRPQGQGLGFRLQGLGFRVEGLGSRVFGLGFRVFKGCRVQDVIDVPRAPIALQCRYHS